MSAYSTRTITRKEAIRMIIACRNKYKGEPTIEVSNKELDAELHKYVYSEEYTDIVGVLNNYEIIDEE